MGIVKLLNSGMFDWLTLELWRVFITLLLVAQGGWVVLYFLNREARDEAFQAHRRFNQAHEHLLKRLGVLTLHLNELTREMRKLNKEGPEEVRMQMAKQLSVLRLLLEKKKDGDD